MKLKFLLLTFSLALASCLPDSLTKYNEDKKGGGITSGQPGDPDPDGDGVTAPVPTTLTCPGGNGSYNPVEIGGTVSLNVDSDQSGDVGFSVSVLVNNIATGAPLPTGLSIDPDTGKISGSPTLHSPRTKYQIVMTHIPSGSTEDCEFYLSSATPIADGDLHLIQEVGKKFILKLNDVSQFTNGEKITSAISPGNEYAKATIDRVSTDDNELYVTFDTATGIDDNYFRVGDNVDDRDGFFNSHGEIETVTYAYDTSSPIEIKPKFVFAKNTLKSSDAEFSEAENTGGISFSISPTASFSTATAIEVGSCPTTNNDGKLYFDPDTGTICGNLDTDPVGTDGDDADNMIDSFDITEYIISAKNANGDIANYTFRLTVVSPPQGLTSGGLLFVKTGNANGTDDFPRGTLISSEKCGMEAEESRGRIHEVIDDQRMLIKVTQGTFSVENCPLGRRSIDDKIPYSNQNTYINSVQNVSFSVIADQGDVTTFAGTYSPGDIVTLGAPETGRAVIIHIDDFTAPHGNSTHGTSLQGDTKGKIYLSISDISTGGAGFATAPTGVIAGTTLINHIDAPNVILDLASSVNYTRGKTVSGDPGSIIVGYNASGVITKKGTANTVHVNSNYDPFTPAQSVDHHSAYGSGTPPETTTVSEIKSQNVYQLYLGEETYIKLGVTSGENLKISLDQELPQGLEIDLANLAITGAPVDSTETGTAVEYKLTAFNGVGSQEHTFSIQIHNHYTISYDEDATGVSSYNFHKAGFGNKTTPCRITEDMMDATTDEHFIECFVDAPERDLNLKGIDFDISVGGGLCSRILFEPFYMQRYQHPVTGYGAAGQSLTNIHVLQVDNIGPFSLNQIVSAGGGNNATGRVVERHQDGANHYIAVETINPGTATGNSNDAGQGWANASGALAGANITGHRQSIASTASACYIQHTYKESIAEDCFPKEYEVDADCNGLRDDINIPGSATFVDSPSCFFDHTRVNDIKENCDFGSYMVTLLEWNDAGGLNTTCDAGESIVADQFTEECGGKARNCFDGPGIDLFSDLGDQNDDIIILYEDAIDGRLSSEGESQLYKIEAPGDPASKNLPTNKYIANYVSTNSCISPSEYSYSSDEWFTANYFSKSEAGYPKYLDPFHRGNPFYNFRCEDGNGETLARARVMIREFDLAYDLTADLDRYIAGGTTPMDDLGGTILDPNNDELDWDDALVIANPYGSCPADQEADTNSRHYDFGL